MLDFFFDLHTMKITKVIFHKLLSEDLPPQTGYLSADIEDLHVHANEDCQYFREIFRHFEELAHFI